MSLLTGFDRGAGHSGEIVSERTSIRAVRANMGLGPLSHMGLPVGFAAQAVVEM